MTLQLGAILILDASQILPSPRIDDLEASALQFRNFAPNSCSLGSVPFRVEHENYGSFQCGRRARPILSGVFSIKRPIWVVSPLVRVGWPADRWVLTEGEEVFVFENGEVIFVKFVKLN